MISVHSSRAQEYVDKGWTEVFRDGMRVDFANPEDTCCSRVRGSDKLCLLNKGHRGSHASVTFYCDGCGRTRRGRPHQQNEHIALCFLCVNFSTWLGY